MGILQFIKEKNCSLLEKQKKKQEKTLSGFGGNGVTVSAEEEEAEHLMGLLQFLLQRCLLVQMVRMGTSENEVKARKRA